MAVLAVTLVYASIRLLRERTDVKSIVFIVTALLVLSGAISLPVLLGIPLPRIGSEDILTFISKGISQVLAVGGARGLLIGIALGVLTTGLRVLLGADRPYGGK
jgi:hypothetical protein